MSWDWKKALGVRDGTPGVAPRTVRPRGPAGPPAASCGGGGRAHACQNEETQCSCAERPRSISWRPAGLGIATAAGSDVPLEEDCEHECPFCRGRGELAGGSVCPVCSGGAKVRVEPPAVRCAFCGGHGQVPPRSNLTCWVCKGKGLVPVTPPVQVCPDCQGRGRRPCESLYCARCRGVGAVEFSYGV